MRRSSPSVLALALVGLVLPLATVSPADAAVRPQAPAVSAASVDEGTVVRVTATIPKPRGARRVELFRWIESPYSVAGRWESVRSLAVRGRAKVRFLVVAAQENRERFRFQVTRRGARTITSKARSVTVWRWIELRRFQPYQTAGSPLFWSKDVAGRTYRTWGAYSSGTSWEGRFTAGRNCSTLRGIFGLADDSYDAASGSMAVDVDGVPKAQISRVVPGQTVPFSVPLNRAYRFTVLLRNTAAPGVRSLPVLAGAELRCTGL